MAKTAKTLELEKSIYNLTRKQGVFGCYEVTIGWFGHERVDYITMDTKNIFRCYEIKVSKADFYSKAKKTFLGDYNYYVIPDELYEKVKDDIPKHIGVYNEHKCIKKAKKQEVKDKDLLKNSMLRSLYRYFEEVTLGKDTGLLKRYQKQIAKLTEDNKSSDKIYKDLLSSVKSGLGPNWDTRLETKQKNCNKEDCKYYKTYKFNGKTYCSSTEICKRMYVDLYEKE